MYISITLRRMTPLVLSLIILSSSMLLAQTKNKKPKPVPPEAKPVLWQEPTDIASRDLFLGPGGDAMQPDLTDVTFIKENPAGFSVKYHVRDGAGRKWSTKLGEEAQPETAAVRLVWAVGYVTEVNYLVPCVHIKGAPAKPRKQVPRCEGDGFANVRFKARPDDVKQLDNNWDWSKNPFVGTRELQGLKVMDALVGNWDIQNHNNNVFVVSDKATGEKVAEYIDTDLGASFAKEGRFIGHTRGRPDQYVESKFIKGVDHGYVVFDFRGKNQHLLKNITVEQAKWIGGLLSQLSDQQIRDAFRAANYSPEQIEALTRVVKERINELVSLPG